MAAVTNSSGAISDSYSYDPLGAATSSGSVPNPYTFGGGSYDSHTGFYYMGSGYYDPATGQSFGCKDKGAVDPGEDLCGEDESLSCGGVCSAPRGGFASTAGTTIDLSVSAASPPSSGGGTFFSDLVGLGECSGRVIAKSYGTEINGVGTVRCNEALPVTLVIRATRYSGDEVVHSVIIARCIGDSITLSICGGSLKCTGFGEFRVSATLTVAFPEGVRRDTGIAPNRVLCL